MTCLNRSLSLCMVYVLGFVTMGMAQNISNRPGDTHLLLSKAPPYQNLAGSMADSILDANAYPDPKSVLYKSLIIPGWGQIVNKQAWKVPIIYGLLGGLTGYSIFLTQKYHDYRAAYYNLSGNPAPTDMRFGPTPSYIPPNANISSLRSNRDNFRNRRDFIYVTIVLAYGLNAIDALSLIHI